jgi:uncharacterized protein YdhG (YjbR/CyaY superfamily)
MAKTNFKTVDEYIARQPEDVQTVLEQVRRAIRRALPKAEEVISYQIPAYRVNGGVLIYFAGWKQHYSLYPAGKRLLTAFKDELSAYEVVKSTIRFPLAKPVPEKLIDRIAKFRAKEAGNRETKSSERKRERVR